MAKYEVTLADEGGTTGIFEADSQAEAEAKARAVLENLSTVYSQPPPDIDTVVVVDGEDG